MKQLIRKILEKFNLTVGKRFPRPFSQFNLENKKNLIGVEIGVYEGEHAYHLLKQLDIKLLYLVDPYKNYEEGLKHHGVEQNPLSVAKKIAHKRIRTKKIMWLEKFSEDAIKDIQDDLDFVYIDGAHDYINVKKDIENYYPKIRAGGVLAGHDFFNGNCKEHNGVIQAVIEFALKNKLQLYVQQGDWWVIKPTKQRG